MTQWFNQLVVGLGLVTAAAALSGCASRDCDPSSFRPSCDGDLLVSCQATNSGGDITPSDTVIDRSTCGTVGMCADDAKGALCVPKGTDLSCHADDVAGVHGDQVTRLIVGDFDGDGASDIVAERDDGYGAKEAETFTFVGATGAVHVSAFEVLHLGSEPLRAGDFDGDGHLDLATITEGSSTDLYGDAEVLFLFGDGRGGFSAPVRTGARSRRPTSVGAADLDGDGVTDLVVDDAGDVRGWSTPNRAARSTPVASFSDEDSRTFALLAGAPEGLLLLHATETKVVAYEVGTTRTAALASVSTCGGAGILGLTAAGDLDGDGLPDVIATCTSARFVSLGWKGARGLVELQHPIDGASNYPITLVLDANGDHHPDVAFVSGNGVVGVALGAPDGTFAAPTFTRPTHDDVRTAAAGDLDGDGRDDLVLGGGFGAEIARGACSP